MRARTGSGDRAKAASRRRPEPGPAAHRALAALAALAVAVPLGVGTLPAPARAEQPASRPPAQAATEPSAPDLLTPVTREQRAEERAVAEAQATGRRVEAPELRTETQTVYAKPDGRMVAEFSSAPVRAKGEDGKWRKIDTELGTGADGLLRPGATAVDLAFSPGGPGADLARMEEGGATLALEPAEDLPTPSTKGGTATYEDVRPGVDLQVVAYSYGFSTRLVVHDREAAERLAAKPFTLGVSGGDDAVRERAGGLQVEAAEGDGSISAPPPSAFDADGRAVALDPGTEPGSVRLALADEAVDGGTEFPITILKDHTADKYGWATVLSGLPTFNGWNTSGEPPLAQVGRCWSGWGACGLRNIGVAWTYWRFDTSFLAGKVVVNADLNAVVEHSPDCNATARYHHVHKATAHPGSGTTWNTKPGYESTYVNMLVPKVNASWGCGGAKTAAADVTSRVNRGGHTSFLVAPADDADVENSPWWRKYNNNAKLVTTYNTVPDAPSGLVTDPPLRTPCKWCAGVPYISDSSVSIKATLTDQDRDALRGVWRYTSNGQTTSYVSPSASASGTVHSRPVTTAENAVNTVTWQVNARDWNNDGPVATGPRFVVDRKAPPAPVVDGYLYTDENRWHGGAGVEGRFDLRTCTNALVQAGRCTDATGDDDVDHYLWGWSSPPANKTDADALGGNATLWTAPPGDGPRSFFVQAVDRAGNKSPVVTQHLRVRPGNGAYADWSLDGTGKDRAYLGDRDMEPADGASYVDGAINRGLLLDGESGHASAPNAVRTDASFSVSAWVRLDDASGARAAVSQDGTRYSGFVLWQRPDEDGDGEDDGGRWAFGMACSDVEYKGTSIASSAEPSETGVLTHLAGTYDARTRKLTLYVDGEKAGEVTRGAACPDWDANGDVQVGRTMWGGDAARDHWDGLVDEVRLYERTLTAAEVQAAVAGSNVQVAQWKFEDKPGSSTTLNSVPGGQAGVLHPDAYLCGDCDADGSEDPSVAEGAVGRAVHVGGADGEVVSSDGPIVTTNRSYSVGGHVRLDPAVADGLAVGDRVVALSQDGTERSGFTVSYVRTGATAGQWEFATYGQDAQGAAPDAVTRVAAADPTTWTHLFAVHDGANGAIRLYLNGNPGDPVERAGTQFAASGPFVIGRGLDGTPSARWGGAVDEVRAFTRALGADEVQAIVTRDDVAVGRWALDGDATSATGAALDGTVHCDGTTSETACKWDPGQSDMPSDENNLDRALTGNGNDWVSAPHAVDTTKSFAVTAWAWIDDLNGTSAIVSQDGQSTSAFQLVKLSNGRWGFQKSSVDGAGTAYVAQGPVAQAEVWTHLAGVYDATAKTITLYVNGEVAGTAAAPVAWDHPAGGLQIGAALGSGNRQNRVLGAIDDVTAYSRALFPDEVRDLAGRDLTLRHSWRMDEGQGDTAADAVGGSTAVAPAAAQVGWTDGVLGNAVELDGVDDHLTAKDLDLRTDGSFTVSAVVQIDRSADCSWKEGEEPAGPGECIHTALSLDGVAGSDSRMRLGYQGGVDAVNENGDWVFEMSNQNRTKAATVKVFSCEPGTPEAPCDFDRPVHLTGIFHAPTGQIWLFVDAMRTSGGYGVEAWQTPGDLQIGRGRDDSGNPAEYFPGVVDDVRAYAGAFNDGRVKELYQFYASGGLLDPVPPEPPAPTHQWKLDETDGTAVAVDSVGRLDATMHNAVAADVIGGRQGKSRTFDGVDSYAVTEGPAVDTGGGFTLSAWVYPRSPADSTGWEVVVESGSSFVITRTGNRWGGVAAWTDADGQTVTKGVYSDENVRVGHWSHLALAYVPNLDQMRLYVNGRMSELVSGVPAVAAADVLRIGAHHDLGLPFNGHIDDVRVFGSGLSDGQVAAVYNDVWDPSYGRWTFDADTVADSSWRTNPTTSGGTVGFVDGRFGRALSLAAATPGFAQTTYSGAPTFGSVTVAARVRVTDGAGTQTVVSQDGTRMSDFSLQYDGDIGRWSFGGWTTDADDATFARAYSGPPAAIGKWAHLVGVYDHPARQLRLYLDGALVGVQDGVTLSAAQRRLAIGRGQVRAANAEYFTGDIDQIDTWMGVLSAREIADLAAQTGPAARTEGDD
ncbi:LamG-like jellyroll fold domain-containing protein [Promicromonospora sp. NPDC057488]|uniref:LamG-like jellyroll fold domain-containing protein n=1 Tax=Promicromonospora sp. NPDC057488 TaxID=3346147 RepID=UPI00366D5911